jgi:hypothetical protein
MTPEWLDGYAGQTVDDLIALEGTYRTDSIVLAFEQALDQKAQRVGAGNLTGEERTILAVEAFEREVDNGGYGQFFVNSSREYAPIIVGALRRIGCPATAAITQRAVTIVETTPIAVEDIERGAWKTNVARQQALDECSALFFGQTEDIAEGLLAFIKANRTSIAP